MRRTRAGLLALALSAPALAGCHSVSDLIGAATGAAATAGSASPAVGILIGIGARAVADWGVRTLSRRWHRTEQDALAATIGEMQEGETRPWQVRHDLPIGNEHGEVRVLRAFDTPLAQCKEVLFSVEEGSGPETTRQWFVTSACRQAGGWKWAAAEPATERWTSLQ